MWKKRSDVVSTDWYEWGLLLVVSPPPRSTKLEDIGEEEEGEEETGDAFDTAVHSKTGVFVSMTKFYHNVFCTLYMALVLYKGGSGRVKTMTIRLLPSETASSMVD